MGHVKRDCHENTLSYPFLADPDTVKYVNLSKLMVLSNGCEKTLTDISLAYVPNATCITEGDERKRENDCQSACVADQHVVGVNIAYPEGAQVANMTPYLSLAKQHNYPVVIDNAPKDLFPIYIGWHLNEADSCMLGLVGRTLLEDLLRTVPEFCSDFRNFSNFETIPEMVKFYELAASNFNGMLHCTAKYFGMAPSADSKEYFEKVNEKLGQYFETQVICLVFTPRTFGARVKLSPSQLDVWGGDEAGRRSRPSTPQMNKERNDSQASEKPASKEQSDTTNSSAAQKCVSLSEPQAEQGRQKRKSPRHFPNCQATLVNLPIEESNDEPDFHPVTGPGIRAHMTLGVAPGVSAVTTGTDLLEVVECESRERVWPTYEGSRGWLRDYGEGRWVLYMKKKIQVGSLFAGVYTV